MSEGTFSIPNFISKQPIFSEFGIQEKWSYFLSTDLGRIYQIIPWDELVQMVHNQLTEKQIQDLSRHDLSIRSKIALMFLKSYSQLSDALLVSRLNTDFIYQFFCHLEVDLLRPFTNEGMPSDVRVYLSRYFDLDKFQQILATAWVDELDCTQIGLQDATCYETSMRYPSGIKLLIECIDYIMDQMVKLCKQNKQRKPRNKYNEQKSKTTAYLKQRKKTHQQKQKRTKSLLYLLDKVILQMDDLLERCVDTQTMSNQFHKRYKIIKQIADQRRIWYQTGEKPENIIVSIDKPYIRPIIRGKENKRVEWGAKVNMLQVDGINFIQKFSFDAFNEGTQYKLAIQLHRQLFGRCKIMGADAIYATNANRKYSTGQKIQTNFKPKGRPKKNIIHVDQKKKLSQEINKERSTVLEGSFGVEKQRYGLQKIRARTEPTEKLWIYFGVHTRNASVLAQRIHSRNEANNKPKAA